MDGAANGAGADEVDLVEGEDDGDVLALEVELFLSHTTIGR